jgi:hypothetical protein
MNLVNGEILDTKQCDAVLESLDLRIQNTLLKPRLEPETVMAACGRLLSSLDEQAYLDSMAALGIDEALGRRYIGEARQMLEPSYLQRRLSIELGRSDMKPYTYTPLFKNGDVTEQLYPLGVLLHIAAGNADGLPAFSVLEGLLTGNINILKLPAEEGGISVRLLSALIEAEPLLAEYIYVFDYSSKDILHIGKLISCADAVVVWGGAEAVTALRKIVPANTRLIEWGHKVSFAYVTERGITDIGLQGLAQNIAETGQLLCSSLQGIFIDTDNMALVDDFCARFLPVMDNELGEKARGADIGVRAQVALRLYNEELEGIYSGSRVYRGMSGSLIAYPDRKLDTSIQLGNAWVRPLPQAELLSVLRPYKNFLQTAALLCEDTEREALSELLFRAGVVHICPGDKMSTTYCGAPHDGEYPLRRYMRIVSME